MGGTVRPAPGNPASAGTEACTRGLKRGETEGAAPRIGAVGSARPGLLTTGLPSGPATLQMMEEGRFKINPIDLKGN